jgi:ketosteroid isomerase-like protein
MSEENVELVRRFYDAFNRHDEDSLKALASPQFRWDPNPDDPERQALRGFEAASDQIHAMWSSLPGLSTEIEETFDVGNHVVAVVQHTATVPGSSSLIERSEAHTWTLEAGTILRLREFPTRKAALEAARSSE